MKSPVSDTIVCDSTRLNSIINSGDFDYNSEIAENQKSLFEKILSDIENWFNDILNGIFSATDKMFSTNRSMGYVWLALAIIAVLVLLYIMYKKKMLFFKKKEKAENDYDVVEDTIYGIDFEEDISRALGCGNYREAIRLRYLQCLKFLSDNEKIDWRIHKTPAQYTREFKNDDFSSLTRQYVLIRYGDYDATQAIFDDISGKYNSIVEQLHIVEPAVETEEGGEHEA